MPDIANKTASSSRNWTAWARLFFFSLMRLVRCSCSQRDSSLMRPGYMHLRTPVFTSLSSALVCRGAKTWPEAHQVGTAQLWPSC
ncbi:hypothetical protein EV126DRAFT_15601 [Verticillium dahliae]|nr:hypothetical protein EV126DRAFT_15601 [Verticillium dahliae]